MKDINSENGHESYCRVHDHFYIQHTITDMCPYCKGKHRINKDLLHKTLNKLEEELKNERTLRGIGKSQGRI